MVMIIVLLVALLVAIYEGVSIADQNQALRVKLNRELRDRENAARAFVAVCLQDVADVFRAHAKETADQAHWATADHTDYNHQLERHLRDLAHQATTTTNQASVSLWIAPIHLEAFHTWCTRHDRDPAADNTRASYAADQARTHPDGGRRDQTSAVEPSGLPRRVRGHPGRREPRRVHEPDLGLQGRGRLPGARPERAQRDPLPLLRLRHVHGRARGVAGRSVRAGQQDRHRPLLSTVLAVLTTPSSVLPVADPIASDEGSP